jgi:NAD(P)-dependent dehydrogenase (short-subunit alcohol dehydrogenase family)
MANLEIVAKQIRSAGGLAETAELDATDETAVNQHADAVAADSGSIDISFNLISVQDRQGTPLAEMAVEDFERPVRIAVRTQFLTASAAARHMTSQGSGVIMMFGGRGARDPLPAYITGGHQVCLGGFQVAMGALDALRRQLACELGPHGIRVVTLESNGLPETIPPPMQGPITQSLVNSSMTKQTATLEDVGNVAAFAASDQARTMTATSFNITCGAQPD